jgi:hypothetical protein
MAHTSHDSAHTEILIRRSSDKGSPIVSGTGLSLLRTGEIAYSYLADPNDDGFGNGGDRLYIGTGPELTSTNETNGEGDSVNRQYSSFISTIGGKYFTDMMNHQRGVVTAASALLVDDNKKLNELLVDVIKLDSDTITTEGGNNLILSPGTQIITSNASINPGITDTYDLGTVSARWNNLSIKNIDANYLNADSAQINNNFNVDGLTTLDSTTIANDLQVTGNFNVDGLTTLDSTTIDGDLTVNKNLFVLGETTNISTTELLVEDKQIVIADNTTTSILADGAGIAVGDSATPLAFMRYADNAGDPQWTFEPKIFAEELEFNVIDCGTYA